MIADLNCGHKVRCHKVAVGIIGSERCAHPAQTALEVARAATTGKGTSSSRAESAREKATGLQPLRHMWRQPSSAVHAGEARYGPCGTDTPFGKLRACPELVEGAGSV